MPYKLTLTPDAEKQLEEFERSGNKLLLRKIAVLQEELREHPRTGMGKPEMLKGNRAGQWSRRINKEHRLIYEIHDNIITVIVLSAKDIINERIRR
ncbi:hypothetical protein FACS189454_10230 [Planctomycetales bacterium]|nr:hypothetical protein FACS189454_10230 [Planctomycetales bacterium]